MLSFLGTTVFRHKIFYIFYKDKLEYVQKWQSLNSIVLQCDGKHILMKTENF